MFQLFDEKEKASFSWDALGDVEDGRRNLGEQMPVQVFRLFQFSVKQILEDRYGHEAAIETFREAGVLAGKEFANNMLDLSLELELFISHLSEVLEEMKIGILRVEKFDVETGEAILTVSEDIDCSGLPVTGETVCNYDEGFIAGILQVYTAKNYVVKEIDCWATGSRVCRFEAKISE